MVVAETVRRTTHPISLTIWLAATVVAAVAGPFGTFQAGSIEVVGLYWLVVIGVSIPLGHAVRITVTKLLSHRPVVLHDVLVPLIMAALYTPFVLHCSRVILGKPPDAGPSHLLFFLTVLIIACMVSILIAVFRMVSEEQDGHGASRASVIGDAAAPPRPRLLERIGASDGVGLVRMTVEDHYVIVHLDDGTVHRLLMRFGDAVIETSGIEGFLTHRSHWVAARAVQRIERDGGREVVRLVDGSCVPVSRTFRARLPDVLASCNASAKVTPGSFTSPAEARGSRAAR